MIISLTVVINAFFAIIRMKASLVLRYYCEKHHKTSHIKFLPGENKFQTQGDRLQLWWAGVLRDGYGRASLRDHTPILAHLLKRIKRSLAGPGDQWSGGGGGKALPNQDNESS